MFILKDPGFFEMVEYFFHKATILAEDNLIDEEMKTMRATREEKVKKAHGNDNVCQSKQILFSLSPQHNNV